MLGYRSNDAVLTICQNNASKSIEIIAANEAASALIGYTSAELAGKKLMSLLPERLSSLLTEYVEYEEDANDVGMVLSKVQSFGINTKDKKEKHFRLKVVRGESSKEKITFRLVLQDAVDLRKDDAVAKAIQENFKGHEVLHPMLGIPDRNSLKKDMELVAHYHHKAQLRSSLVLVAIDHFGAYEKQYSDDLCVDFIKHIITVCRGNLRPGDVVAAASDTTLGILLLDSVSDATRMVANRLRWQIAAHPFNLPDKSLLSLSASMVYININGAGDANKLLAACESALIASEGAASHLSEATV